MRDRVRALAAVAVAMASLAAGLMGSTRAPIQFTGVTLARTSGGIEILDVDPASPAHGFLQPGQRVVTINDRPVGEIDELDPSLDLYLSGEFFKLGLEDGSGPNEFTFPSEPAGRGSPLPLYLGVLLLVAVGAWIGRGLAGEGLRPLALPVAASSAAPMLVAPILGDGSALGLVAASGLPALGALVLAQGILARIAVPKARRLAIIAVAGGIGLTLVVTALAIRELPNAPAATVGLQLRVGSAVALGLILLPAAGILVSTSRFLRPPSQIQRAEALPVAVAAMTPVVLAVSATYLSFELGLVLTPVWLLVAVLLLQSNARLQTLRLQRDTVVAATEAERARLAADLHDDALQQVTVLVRRLDDRGATEDAEIARAIAERLRDVCGELRLPILDELGAGPALEWLVERVSQLTGGEIRLERADTARPPASVELAFFRVAQEALANAVHHGAPPIVVSYAAGADTAALSVSDRGAGIAPSAVTSAPRKGHYGMLNMRQRAEQIGARLEIGRAEEGGTSIGLHWGMA